MSNCYLLNRNAKLFISTVDPADLCFSELNSLGLPNKVVGFSERNTWRLPILDGFSFSQSTTSTEVTINEAGAAPNRGQRSFNDSLDPVDVSFSTYMRPFQFTDGTSRYFTATELPALAGLVGNMLPSIVNTVEVTKYETAVPTDTSVGYTVGEYIFVNSGDAAAGVYVVNDLINDVTRVPQYSAGKTIENLYVTVLTAGVASASYTLDAGSYILGTDALVFTQDLTTRTAQETIRATSGVVIGSMDSNDVSTLDHLLIHSRNSDEHQLLKLHLYFELDGSWMAIRDVQMSSASIDFDIEGLAMIAWSAQGTRLYRIAAVDFADNGGTDYTWDDLVGDETDLAKLDAGVAINIDAIGPYVNSAVATDEGLIPYFGGNADFDTGTLSSGADNVPRVGNYSPLSPTSDYLSTKLTAVKIIPYLADGSGMLDPDKAKWYDIPLTGGNVTYENNVTYLTPETLGVVDYPVTSFTGTRAISGSMNCYFKLAADGTGRGSADLLDDLLSKVEETTNEYYLVFSMGNDNKPEIDASGMRIEPGVTAKAPRAEIHLPYAMIKIPTVETEEVFSTTIEFTAQGSKEPGCTSFEPDEFEMRYYPSTGGEGSCNSASILDNLITTSRTVTP